MQDENSNGMTIEYIVENYSRMVTSICRRMIQNKEAAKDAVQEVWFEVVKSLKSFQSCCQNGQRGTLIFHPLSE